MKVYLAEFKYKDSPQLVWYKLGYTLERDAALRFVGEEYNSFDIRILSSIYISNPDYNKAVELCKEVEDYLLRKFPKKFVLEEYLNVPPQTFKGLSGITEMFLLPYGMTHQSLIDFFNKVKVSRNCLVIKCFKSKVRCNPYFSSNHCSVKQFS